MMFTVPIKSNAASLPSYSTNDDGEIVVDGEFSEDGEKITYDEPISVPEFEEIEGENDAGIDNSNVSDEIVQEVPVPSQETSLETQTAPSEISISDASPAAVYAADAYAVSSTFEPENCLRFSVTYNSRPATLLIPASFYESVWVDDNGVIWNVGTTTISGRLIFSDTINDSDYDMYLVQILSCISSTSAPSSVFNNGSLTEVRHYYLGSQNRIQYTSSYGSLTSTGDNSILSRNPVAVNKLMFTIVIALLLGGGFICYRKH